MAVNVAIIVVAMLAVVGFTGLCSFNPGTPENGPVQTVDAETFLGLEARAVDFPVRYPQMPEGWTPNSARRSMIADAPAPVVGWVTPAGGYIQLTQTGASLDDAISGLDSHPRERDRTDSVTGVEVSIFTSAEKDVRNVWAVDAGDARLLVTGAGTDEEHREVIAAALAAAPISRG